jgi:hypothetical protein
VGYFLLTGQTVFGARTLGELCQQHITAVPDAPSHKLGRGISEGLEHAILACLEKARAKRPQTARDLAAMLARVVCDWSLDDAEAWWSRHERGQQPSGVSSFGGSSRFARESGNVSASDSSSQVKVSTDAPTMPPGFDRTAIFDPPDDPPT